MRHICAISCANAKSLKHQYGYDFCCHFSLIIICFRVLGNGPFAEWYQKAKDLDVDERSDCLAKSSVATAHETCANSGETDSQPLKVEHHFITYINSDGRLYEFGKQNLSKSFSSGLRTFSADSRQSFPRICGPTTQETLIKDAGVHCVDLARQVS